tara:strand:+ start:373 stop:576 length:204 start_codon:yes stop_codon:yes gene_type:complete
MKDFKQARYLYNSFHSLGEVTNEGDTNWSNNIKKSNKTEYVKINEGGCDLKLLEPSTHIIKKEITEI